MASDAPDTPTTDAPAGSAADLIGGVTSTAPATPDAVTLDPSPVAGDPAPDWFSMLSSDAAAADTPSNLDWVKEKGFKDLDGVVKSYREAEKAVRASGKITIPGESATPEERAAFGRAIGVPEKADDYQVALPDGVTDASLNEPLIARLREAALASGTPKVAFEHLAGEFIKSQLDEMHAETARQNDLATAKVKEWGGNRDAKIAAIDTAARTLQLSATDMNGLRAGLGADRALDLLSQLGEGMGEGALIGGGKQSFGVTAEQAQVELDRMKAEPGMLDKLRVAGSAEAARWSRLNDALAQQKAARSNEL